MLPQLQLQRIWKLLPIEIYVKIFKDLSTIDRMNASYVCKAWNHSFTSPELWRKVRVRFKNDEDKRFKAIAIKYGEHIRHIHVVCFQKNEENCRNVCRFLDLICNKEKIVIESFKIELCEENPLFFTGNIFRYHLKAFLTAAKNIQRIDFSQFHVVIHDDLLKVITQNHGSTIRSLNLQNKMLVCGLSPTSLLDFIKEAKNLQYLYIQSSCFSNDALQILTENKHTKLKLLSLNFKRADKFLKAIASESWQRTRQELPALRIEIHFDKTYPSDSTHKFMVAEAPVSVLKLCLQATVARHIDLAASLYKTTLETLVIKSTPSVDLDNAVLRALRECQSLKDIHVLCELAQDVVTAIHKLKSLKKYTLGFIDGSARENTNMEF